MADIARFLGVSVQTVSAVVNGKPGISMATQVRVREAIEEHGFLPNQQARTLRGIPSKTIGVIIPSITNPYFPEFVKGIEEEARKMGYSIFLCNTDHQMEHLLDYLALVRTHQASGVISLGMAPEWLGDPDITDRLRRFARDGVSVVLNGHIPTDLPVSFVNVRDEAAIREGAEHLINLGHTRIGMVAPPAGLPVSAGRVISFRSAFEAFGHVLDESMIVPGGFELESGYRAAQHLMAKRRKPTAIIAANDLSAFGVIAGLSAMGISVPQDVSVMGFDDIAFAQVFQPALSTIAQPVFELGREALRLAIVPPVPAGEEARGVTLEARFIARNSTGLASPDQELVRRSAPTMHGNRARGRGK